MSKPRVNRTEQVRQFLAQYPGAQFAAIRKALGMDPGPASRVVSDAVKAGGVVAIGMRRKRMYYVAGSEPVLRRAVASVFDLGSYWA